MKDQLITSTHPDPPRVIVYGVAGVGKTSVAAQAEAVLIDCENGAGAIPGLTRTPYLQDWPSIRSWLVEFVSSPPESRVLAIDTIDWMMRRIIEHVILEMDPKAKLDDGQFDFKSTLNSAHGGYGRARDIVKNVVWKDLIPLLNRISQQGCAILLLAHARNGKASDPEGHDINTAQPELDDWIAPAFTEWADAVLYARREPDDSRILVTRHRPTIFAKNRYELPEELPLSWHEITAGISNHFAPQAQEATDG
ncbi:MAG: ATP-binding protein [Planctomycetota bacterium]